MFVHWGSELTCQGPRLTYDLVRLVVEALLMAQCQPSLRRRPAVRVSLL